MGDKLRIKKRKRLCFEKTEIGLCEKGSRQFSVLLLFMNKSSVCAQCMMVVKIDMGVFFMNCLNCGNLCIFVKS